jgi:CheY-like chemotaxis protein
MDNKTMVETSILFVDDEMVIRKSFTRELQIEHFAVTAVAIGSKAINALESRQYRLDMLQGDGNPEGNSCGHKACHYPCCHMTIALRQPS